MGLTNGNYVPGTFLTQQLTGFPPPNPMLLPAYIPNPPDKPPGTLSVTPEVIPNPLRKAIGLVTPAELAAALNVQEETLAVWRSTGKGPAYIKLGKHVFYRMNDLDWWVDTRMPEKGTLPSSGYDPLKPLIPMEGLAGVDDADEEVPPAQIASI